MKSPRGVEFSRRVLLHSGLASSLGLFSPALLNGQESQAMNNFITPETDRSISSGLRFLAEQQTEDGAFGTSGYQRNVAICALSGMALMASGSTPSRGPYGKQLDRCIEYLRATDPCIAHCGIVDLRMTHMSMI